MKSKVGWIAGVPVWSLTVGVAASLGALAEQTMRLQCTIQDGQVSLVSASVTRLSSTGR